MRDNFRRSSLSLSSPLLSSPPDLNSGGFPRGAGGRGENSPAAPVPDAENPPENPPEFACAGGPDPEGAEALLAYAAGLGIVPGPTWTGRLPPYPARVLRLCLDLAEGERHQRLDVLLGRMLPRLLHRVHRLGLALRRDYGFACPCGESAAPGRRA